MWYLSKDEVSCLFYKLCLKKLFYKHCLKKFYFGMDILFLLSVYFLQVEQHAMIKQPNYIFMKERFLHNR